MVVNRIQQRKSFFKGRIKQFGFASFFAVLFTVLTSQSGLAASEVNDVAANMVTSVNQLPGLVSALSYILGLLLGVLGVLKIRDHVESPQQTPLRVGLIRLLIGGSLFALPIVYETVLNTIGNNAQSFDNDAIANDISGFFGGVGGVVGLNFNSILESIRDSVDQIPALISAVAYLLGLVIAVQGALKIKDHVENPDQTALKESVIRFLVAGALFGLPTIYNAMFDVVGGNGLGIIGNITSILGGLGFLFSSYAGTACNPVTGTVTTILGNASFGQQLCGILTHAGAFPAFLSACGYVIGLVFGVWGIFKIRDHVMNPQQTSVWEGVSRLIAGGAFFALPIVVEVARNTLGTGLLTGSSLVPTTGYNAGGGFLATLIGSIVGGGGCSAASGTTTTGNLGLDGLLVCLMTDVMGPLHVVLNFFAFCAGMILLMIGVSRLIKSAQDGARGPGGIGTIMTFVTGGALISYNEMMRAFSTTLTGSPLTRTFATIQYDICGAGAATCAEAESAHAVISAIIQFVIIIGLISFVRGIFIIRGVAEGNQQASIMAGVTHLIGGALAVNLGPLINAIQTTLGIGNFGIAFT
ncbi:MAG: hypothetical protein AAF204_02945 [Pseudomonadota bacterium]